MTHVFPSTTRPTATAPAAEPLEPRRLLSADLTFGPLNIEHRFAYAHPTEWVPILFDVTVKNIGTTHATGTPIGVTFTRDTILGNADDVIASQVNFPSDWIIPGNEYKYSGSASFPAGTAAGGYYIAVILDPQNVIKESNEKNNLAITATPVVTVVSKTWPLGPIVGTSGDDVIRIHQPTFDTFITVNGETRRWDASQVAVTIDGGSGNDLIVAEPLHGKLPTRRLMITGSGGNDTIIGGDGHDELSGANGRDKVYGNGGNDYLLGGAHNDTLDGGEGNDTLSGAGGNDRLYGTRGRNWLIGGAGNDLLYSRQEPGYYNERDTVSGGAGHDRALVDADDILASIEEFLG